MLIWLESWLRLAVGKVLRDERGQGELLVILLLIFIIYLVSTGRRVTVQ
ncbi:MAG: hypothetical protein ACRDGN_13235 [bacterium]